MKGKICKSTFKNEYNPTGATYITYYHEIEVDSDGQLLVGSIGCKEKNPAFLAVGQEFEFEFDAQTKKFKKSQAQGQAKSWGGASAEFKPSEQQWINMQKGITAQSCINHAVAFAQNKDVKAKDVLQIAEAFYQFVISKSDFK